MDVLCFCFWRVQLHIARSSCVGVRWVAVEGRQSSATPDEHTLECRLGKDTVSVTSLLMLVAGAWPIDV